MLTVQCVGTMSVTRSARCSFSVTDLRRVYCDIMSQFVVGACITSDGLLLTWDLYSQQFGSSQKLWGAQDHTQCEFLLNVALM